MAPKYSTAQWQADSSPDGGHWNVGMNSEALNEYLDYMPPNQSVGTSTWVPKADSPDGGFYVVAMTDVEYNAFVDTQNAYANKYNAENFPTVSASVPAGGSLIAPPAAKSGGVPAWIWGVTIGLGLLFVVARAKG